MMSFSTQGFSPLPGARADAGRLMAQSSFAAVVNFLGWVHEQVCVVGHEDQRDEGLPLCFERLVQAARKDPAV